MKKNKAYKSFNIIMLIVLIVTGILLAGFILFNKTNFFYKQDAYGCKSNEGYTYSYAQNKCIHVYNTALRMTESGSSNPNSLKAFLIFSEDNKTADLFLPGKKHIFLTTKDNFSSWTDNLSTYTIINKHDKLSLMYNGSEIYYINRQN